MVLAKSHGKPYDEEALAARLRSAVAGVVQQQIAVDLDSINDGEFSAERLLKYAAVVGRDNVIAGTDCGLGTRVGHPKIAWPKFEALAAGAQIASKQLWG
jgi:methionine synthase II (cobalamin-independent)